MHYNLSWKKSYFLSGKNRLIVANMYTYRYRRYHLGLH